MLYRIFDQLDGTTIILSLRAVCRNSSAAHVGLCFNVQTWFSSSSSSDLSEICHCSQSVRRRENIWIDRCISRTLRRRLKWYEPPAKKEIVENLSPINGQSILLRLDLLSNDLSVLINELEWTSQSKLRSLRLATDSQLQLFKVLDRLPHIETLLLPDNSEETYSFCVLSEGAFSTIHPRLTSVTISHKHTLPYYARAPLSHTPSLTYLKISGTSDPMTDGFRWEELIKTKLPALNRFEFHEI